TISASRKKRFAVAQLGLRLRLASEICSAFRRMQQLLPRADDTRDENILRLRAGSRIPVSRLASRDHNSAGPHEPMRHLPGPPLRRVGRAENGDRRALTGRGEMHRGGVHSDEKLSAMEQSGQLLPRGLPGGAENIWSKDC